MIQFERLDCSCIVCVFVCPKFTSVFEYKNRYKIKKPYVKRTNTCMPKNVPVEKFPFDKSSELPFEVREFLTKLL